MEVAIKTIRKLQEMRLSVMAKTYLDQMEHLEDYANMSFDERFPLIVDREANVRLNNNLKRLVHQAQFLNEHAALEDIQYLSDRHLNHELIRTLRSNSYIDKKQNVIFVGATGSGKTFLRTRWASMLAMLVTKCGTYGYQTSSLSTPAPR